METRVEEHQDMKPTEVSRYEVSPGQSLERIRAAIQRSTGYGAMGPLITAPGIVAIASVWDEQYRETSGGLTCSQWLRCGGKGRHLGWWQRRADAVKGLGRGCRQYADHEAACYIVEHAGPFLQEAKKMLIQEFRDNGNNPIKVDVARNKLNEIIGKKPKKKSCARCRVLERLLRAHGIDADAEIN